MEYYSVDLCLVFSELLHSDGFCFFICSFRMALHSNSFSLFVCLLFWGGIWNLLKYYVLTDFAILFESDVVRNSFFGFAGSLPVRLFFTDCFPGSEFGTLSKISNELPLHCTLESFLSLRRLVVHFLTWTGRSYFLKKWENRDTSLSKYGSRFFAFIVQQEI